MMSDKSYMHFLEEGVLNYWHTQGLNFEYYLYNQTDSFALCSLQSAGLQCMLV